MEEDEQGIEHGMHRDAPKQAESLLWCQPRELRDNIYKFVLSSRITRDGASHLRLISQVQAEALIEGPGDHSCLRKYHSSLPPPAYFPSPSLPFYWTLRSILGNSRLLDTRVTTANRRLRDEILEYINDNVPVLVALQRGMRIEGDILRVLHSARHIIIQVQRFSDNFITQGSHYDNGGSAPSWTCLEQLTPVLSCRSDIISFRCLIDACAPLRISRTGFGILRRENYDREVERDVLTFMRGLTLVKASKSIEMKWQHEKHVAMAGKEVEDEYWKVKREIMRGVGGREDEV